MLQGLNSFFKSKAVNLSAHILFWLFYGAFWFIYAGDGDDLQQRLALTACLLLFHAGGAYFNIYVLIPFQLQKKEYLLYILCLILLIFLLCFPVLWSVFIINIMKYPQMPADQIWNFQYFLRTAISISYTVFITMAISIFFRWFKKEQQARDLEVLNAQTELKYLKSQINPHFLFNALNNLYSLALKKSPHTPDYILRLSEMLRYLLYESKDHLVPLNKELEYLTNYIEIEKLRFGDRAEISFATSGETEHFLTEPMLLLPFIENSVKHGLISMNRGGWMKVQIELTDTRFYFKVVNNFKTTNGVLYGQEYQGGIGIKNVQKRLQLLYPGKHELKINKFDDIFEVVLIMNLE